MGEKKKTGEGGHQALYRKYRSKKLSEVIGQEHVTKTLENAIKNGKINHAYLFTGPRGTGKTSIARILAHEINNLPYNDETPHLDIIEIDAASNRRIDDIRDLRDKVRIAPLSAKYKVYIIDEVHMLTNESFNALLKTLEEPPEHVIFFLATTEIHKLPATILSRTQRHSLRLVSEEKVTKHLETIAQKEGIKYEPESLKLLALHGGGSFRDSISLLDQLGSGGEKITTELVELLLGVAPKEALLKLVQSTRSGESAQIITQIENLLQNGLTASGIASQLLRILREDVKEGNATEETVSLMSELLLVHSAQYPQLKLETILVSVAPKKLQHTNSKESVPAVAKATLSTKDSVSRGQPQLQKIESPPKKKQETETVKPVEKTKNSVGEIDTATFLQCWPEILDETKKINNSLYTVLRLAAPEINNQELTLFFSFKFHQKKLEEPKNKAAVITIIKEITGRPLTLVAKVDKSKVKPLIEPSVTSLASSDAAHASLISNVQDIMGGGEIVNV